MQKIIENKVKCKVCGDIVESTSKFTSTCKCGKTKISGGYENLQRFNLTEGRDFDELSKFYIVD